MVDAARRLKGVLTPRNLVLAEAGTRLGDLAETPTAMVGSEAPQEEVARMLRRYGLPTIGVVDEAGVLLGHVTWDDVLDVLEAEQTEDILRL